MDSFGAGKHLFLGDFLGLILLGFLKLNILGMAPGFEGWGGGYDHKFKTKDNDFNKDHFKVLLFVFSLRFI